MQERIRMTFGRWMLLFLAGWAACQGVLIALVSFILNLPIQSLGLAYLLLLWCGFVAGSLIYWARQSYRKPKSGAIRFTFVTFSFLIMYMGALLLAAVKLAILSTGSALNDYAPYILPVSALASVVVYIMSRRRLEAVPRDEV